MYLRPMFSLNYRVSMHTVSMIQIHTPFVRVGLKSQNFIQMKPNMGFSMEAKFGNSYIFKSEVPRQETDVFVVR